MEQNEITVGPVTAKLLEALKLVETARDRYFEAMQGLRGKPDDFEDHMTQEETAAFDQLRDVVENMIGDNIRTWANSYQRSEI